MLEMESILREFESLPVDSIKNFWNPQKCREDLLPYLALYLGVNQWDSS
jgi:phage tail P2-like protein